MCCPGQVTLAVEAIAAEPSDASLDQVPKIRILARVLANADA